MMCLSAFIRAGCLRVIFSNIKASFLPENSYFGGAGVRDQINVTTQNVIVFLRIAFHANRSQFRLSSWKFYVIRNPMVLWTESHDGGISPFLPKKRSR